MGDKRVLRLSITEPLVDEHFNPLKTPYAVEVAEKLTDYSALYKLNVVMNDSTMMYTALVFTLRERKNFEVTVTFPKTYTNEWLESILLSSPNVKKVVYE